MLGNKRTYYDPSLLSSEEDYLGDDGYYDEHPPVVVDDDDVPFYADNDYDDYDYDDVNSKQMASTRNVDKTSAGKASNLTKRPRIIPGSSLVDLVGNDDVVKPPVSHTSMPGFGQSMNRALDAHIDTTTLIVDKAKIPTTAPASAVDVSTAATQISAITTSATNVPNPNKDAFEKTFNSVKTGLTYTVQKYCSGDNCQERDLMVFSPSSSFMLLSCGHIVCGKCLYLGCEPSSFTFKCPSCQKINMLTLSRG